MKPSVNLSCQQNALVTHKQPRVCADSLMWAKHTFSERSHQCFWLHLLRVGVLVKVKWSGTTTMSAWLLCEIMIEAGYQQQKKHNKSRKEIFNFFFCYFLLNTAQLSALPIWIDHKWYFFFNQNIICCKWTKSKASGLMMAQPNMDWKMVQRIWFSSHCGFSLTTNKDRFF